MRILPSSLTLLLSLCISNNLPVSESFALVQQQRSHTIGRTTSTSPTTLKQQQQVVTLSASSSSSSNSRLDDLLKNQRNKKTVSDRTIDEWRALVQNVVTAIMEAGPRAGPARTLQATRAVSDTLQEYIPTLQNGFRPKSKFEPAVALRQLFERLGATYIKLGQFVASSPTLFPAEYVTEFQKCLDQTEKLDWDTKIRPILEKELGGSAALTRLFSSIDSKPLASASIAQVHKAVLRETGETVVLKIQKPGIDELLKADLGFLKISSEILEFVQPDWERTSLKDIGGDIQRSMLEELDFQKEAQNLEEFRQFLQDQQLTSVATAPRVFPAYTTKKVLCMEFLDGVSLLDTDAMSDILAKTSSNSNNIAPSLESTIVTALNVWTTSVQTMPWFHADVHAGNLLLLKNDGRVGFLDFGIVGRVSPKTFNAVQELSLALTVGDYTAMAEALANMGATSDEVNIPKFASDLEQVMGKLMSVQPDVLLDTTQDMASMSVDVEGEEITNLMLDVVAVTENNGLRLPREFGLLVKQSLYFDRYLKILAPGLDVMNDDRVGLSSSKENDMIVNEQAGSLSSNNNNNNDVVIDV